MLEHIGRQRVKNMLNFICCFLTLVIHIYIVLLYFLYSKCLYILIIYNKIFKNSEIYNLHL